MCKKGTYKAINKVDTMTFCVWISDKVNDYRLCSVEWRGQYLLQVVEDKYHSMDSPKSID